jgi:hypothetical protein
VARNTPSVARETWQETTMTKKVTDFLAERTEDVLTAAGASVARAHLPHYERAGEAVSRERLRALYGLVVRCAAERHLGPMLDHVAQLARDRHAAGFNLGEVQTAINVLEEAIWRAILSDVPAAEQGAALGVVSTILGAAKDRLACTYVSLATQTATPSLDLTELFHGTAEGQVLVQDRSLRT